MPHDVKKSMSRARVAHPAAVIVSVNGCAASPMTSTCMWMVPARLVSRPPGALARV